MGAGTSVTNGTTTASEAAFDGFWTASLTFSLPIDCTAAILDFYNLVADDRAVLEVNGNYLGTDGSGSSAGIVTGPGSHMVLKDHGTPTQNWAFQDNSLGGASGTFMSDLFNYGAGNTNTLTLIVNNTNYGTSWGDPNSTGSTSAGLTGCVIFQGGPTSCPTPPPTPYTPPPTPLPSVPEPASLS